MEKKNKNWYHRTPRQLIAHLAQEALMSRVLLPHVRRKPGETILYLSDEERKILKQLRPEDMDKLRPFAYETEVIDNHERRNREQWNSKK